MLISLGGKVLGSVKHPIGTTDFSSYLLQAQSSGAKVVALADTGTDLINAVKQAAEFGLTQKQILAGLFTQIVDVNSIGLQAAQGLTVTEAFYWDLNDNTRAFARRFAQRFNGTDADRQPGRRLFIRAGLSERGEVGRTRSWARTWLWRRCASNPIEDKLFGTVTVRQDGRAVHDMYTFKVKTPAKSKARWDDYKVLARIPGRSRRSGR